MARITAKSRVARKPVVLVKDVAVTFKDNTLVVKGQKGELTCQIPAGVEVAQEAGELLFSPSNESKEANMMAGTLRANVQSMVIGVSQGYEKKLVLRGTGYKTQIKGDVLNLSVGKSHPVNFDIPAGITMEAPTATEVIIRGIDKQRVGQIAANVRSVRPPECYKGKGVRYSDEIVKIKETKKK